MIPCPLEKDIQRGILDYLTLKGHFVHIIKAGGFKKSYKGKDYFIRTAKKGTVDLLGVTKAGRALAIEVKRPGGKPTLEQQEFLADYNKRGGLGLVAYSVDNVIAAGL
jgi:hypothetical protein